jgi:hypothetical protein
MLEYSRFSIKDCTFIALGPENDEEAREWTIRVNKDVYTDNKHEAVLIKEVKVPLIHKPLFGYDVDDLENLNEKVEEIIVELKLE